jgi:hypothetical protein
MLAYLADEDLNNRIIRGLLRRQPDLDIIRLQDTLLAGEDDSDVLEWANQHGRVVVTHDLKTMTKYAFARMRSSQTTWGVIGLSQSMPIGQAIEDLLLVATSYSPEELENRVVYLPL